MLWVVAAFLQFLAITLTINTKNQKITPAEMWSLRFIKTIISIFVFICVRKA